MLEDIHTLNYSRVRESQCINGSAINMTDQAALCDRRRFACQTRVGHQYPVSLSRPALTLDWSHSEKRRCMRK